jgi:hypothetical protein
VKKELPVKVLDKSLPLWTAELLDDDLEARIDNNWYSPAAFYAYAEMVKVTRHGAYTLATLGALCDKKDGIGPGYSPEEEGDVGMIEGRNLRPNYVIPIFTKYTAKPMNMEVGDLLVGKDGEPGTVAVITQVLLDYCKELTVGNHVYHVRLLEKHRPVAPFIAAFLNSRNGQAIIRKCIAGGTTPTIRKADIEELPVLIPTDGKCPASVQKAVIQTQKWVIDSMDNLGPSKGMAAMLGMRDVDIRLPTNWAGGGASRSSRVTH